MIFFVCSKLSERSKFRYIKSTSLITLAKFSAVSDSNSGLYASAAAIFSSRLKGFASPASMVTRMVSLSPSSALFETIRVANRVQSSSPIGNGMLVKLCSSEDLPADCLPTITSCEG